MYFVPLSQLESVELLVHSLKIAAGEADCSTCPAFKVCMKQCLVIANSIEQMLQSETLPQTGKGQAETSASEPDDDPNQPSKGSFGKERLKIVK